MFRRTSSSRPHAPRRSAPRRANAPRTSRSRPARRARLLTRRAKLNAARRPRRGVLLLVVLSLLVLFLMVGMAFVVTAKQSEKAAKSSMKAAVRVAGEAAQADLLDEVLMQIVRDTNNPNSSLRFHSLLGDMYGNDGLKGVIVPTATLTAPVPPKFAGSTGGADQGPTGGQIIEFQIGTAGIGATGLEVLRDLRGNDRDAAGPLAFSSIDDAYNGQVLTFLSGIAKGRSTRIVGFTPPNTFRVMNVQLENGLPIANPSVLANTANPTRVLINGRPFSGTGVGFNPWADENAPKLNASEVLPNGAGTFPIALLPNASYLLPSPTVQLPTTGTLPGGANYFPFPYVAGGTVTPDFNGRGGANETYDAPDFQNMFLGMLSDAGGGRKEFEDPGAGSPDLDEVGIPSFHRPDLIYYFNNLGGANLTQNPILLRRMLLSPSWFDHPRFNGSNPDRAAAVAALATALEAQNNNVAHTAVQTHAEILLSKAMLGPWDVDNDNDGFRDSVWVDVGLPVMAGPNGKLVKPLAAILVIDMDGKLNVNAAGSCDLAEAWNGTGLQTLTAVSSPPAQLAGTGMTSDGTPRGLGYGPADISLKPALNPNPLPDPPNFTWLLTGYDFGGGMAFPGRYGYANGSTNVILPGVAGQQQVMAQVMLNGWPKSANVLSSFASPPDLRARYGSGLNAYGQPMFDATKSAVIRSVSDNLAVNSPYELNLSQKATSGAQSTTGVNSPDTPFSPAEMERVLRMFDADAGALPPRLAMLAGIVGSGTADPSDRLRITTDSFDLPSPNIALPHELSSMLSTNPNYRRQPRSAAELIEIRVRHALGRSNPAFTKFPEPLDVPPSVTNATAVRNIVRRLLAPELVDGLRIDVNRALGNGRDDNGNGVVDEPGEQGKLWDLQMYGRAASAAELDYATPDFPGSAHELVADPNPRVEWVDHRHLMARHLYVTALALTAEEDYTGTTQAQQQLARSIAQWAINSVDFRDADNIMTPFEYDLNPFDGWDYDGYLGATPGPDGILGTADDGTSPDDAVAPMRGVVWGAERPELVITESAAWHDRRTLDEANETPDPDEGDNQTQGAIYSTDPGQDASFDQGVRPRGAWFLELYNPWPASGLANQDTHAVNVQSPTERYDLGVDLAAVDPINRNPVWRLAVYRTDPSDPQILDPDDPELLRRPKQNDLDRTVYFTGRDPDFDGDAVAFFNRTAYPVPSVRPGRYMVVGSGKETGANTGIFESPLGDLKLNPPPGAVQRKIVLNANPGAVHAVQLMGSDGNVQQSTGNPSFPVQSPDLTDHPDRSQFPNNSAVTEGDTALNRTGLSDVAIIDQSTDGTTNTAERRRLTLTEPAEGYPSAVGDSVWSDTSNSAQSDGEGEYIDQFNNPKPIDIPLDDNRADGEMRLSTIGSVPNFRVVYLQRLANPLLPWNPESGDPEHRTGQPVNPYLTIDHMSTNVTVFNGKAGNPNIAGGTEPILGQMCDNFDAMEEMASMQRGQQNEQQQGRVNLWSPEVPGERRVTQLPNDSQTHIFEGIPDVTLGFLNREFMDRAPAPGDGDKIRLRTTPPTATPFPWLTWNNRPYVSGNELMLVPRARSSQLLRYFSLKNNGKPYDARPPQPPQEERLQLPFGHVVNFFQDDDGAPEFAIKHLYRILEFVQTPSLFVGTKTSMDPDATRFGQPVTLATDPADPRLRFQPPFNSISEFREPGRINLNTIAGEEVWAGLFHGNPSPTPSGLTHPGPTWDSFEASRRGINGKSMLEFDSTTPSFFNNPFRSPDAGDLVPVQEMVRAGVDCGLLRSVNPTAATPGNEPLFAAKTVGGGNEFRDSDRNPYFQFQPMIRLDNLVTNRSNVYAVWVTIGFFEVEDAPEYNDFRTRNGNLPDDAMAQALYRRVYPEGYAFAREDGVDVGNVRRLRGFYMIDRTKMAGFEPGADHNVEEVIRLRRRIE